jgi:hypothetical protein
VATGKEHLSEIRANSLVHTSRGVRVDHVVDVCGAGTLEQSLNVDEGS